MNRSAYTVEEIAEMTGYSTERLQRAIEAGNLALTQTSDSEEQRVTKVELERWWHGVEQNDELLFEEERAEENG